MKTPMQILLVTAFLFTIFNMVGLGLFREQVFSDREQLSLSELLIAIGFGLILLSVPASMIWLLGSSGSDRVPSIHRIMLMFWGALVLLSLMVVKTMADEIAKELLVGWSSGGEWAILYASMCWQSIYLWVMIRKVDPAPAEKERG